MASRGGSEQDATWERVATALREGALAPLDPAATVHETHCSVVALGEDRAWKLKRPVHFSFLDFSTLEHRREACVAELAVNQELAPGTYLALRPVLERAGQLCLGPPGPDPDAVEYLVEMRRFDEARTMAALLAGGELGDEDVEEVAARVAAFHATATPCAPQTLAELRWRALADLEDVGGVGPEVLARELSVGFVAGALRRHHDELADRAGRGCHRDGHGDLRADHIVLERPLLIVDRLEFDPDLRRGDIGRDLAFLLMDLERRGGGWVATRLLEAYRAAGGDAPGAGLTAFFVFMRAIVAVKVALLSPEPGDVAGALRVAERAAWSSRTPPVLVLCGPPASGKSTLAAAVAELLGAPIVSSDLVRKELHGVAPTAPAGPAAYTPQATDEVYSELGRRVHGLRATHEHVVVDATCRSAALRARLLGELDRSDREAAVLVLCDAPLATALGRIHAREATAHVSDATAGVTRELYRGFEPLLELPSHAVGVVGTAGSPGDSLLAIARRLDAR